jgi:hypothetical protein
LPIARIVALFVALALGAALGLSSAWLALRAGLAFGAVRAGPWVAHPHAGGLARDPYAAAALARTGETPFDVAEGVAFLARDDSAGAPLDGACDYRVKGAVPAARFWTLTASDASGRVVANPAGRFGFTSTELARAESGAFEIALSPDVRPGMWLPTSGVGDLALTLRLYDASAAGSASSLKAADLPRVEKLGCAGAPS